LFNDNDQVVNIDGQHRFAKLLFYIDNNIANMIIALVINFTLTPLKKHNTLLRGFNCWLKVEAKQNPANWYKSGLKVLIF